MLQIKLDSLQILIQWFQALPWFQQVMPAGLLVRPKLPRGLISLKYWHFCTRKVRGLSHLSAIQPITSLIEPFQGLFCLGSPKTGVELTLIGVSRIWLSQLLKASISSSCKSRSRLFQILSLQSLFWVSPLRLTSHQRRPRRRRAQSRELRFFSGNR